MRRLALAALGLLAAAAALSAFSEPLSLVALRPEDSQERRESRVLEPAPGAPWYSVSFEDNTLTIEAVITTRSPDSTFTAAPAEPPQPGDPAAHFEKPDRWALALPKGALFGVRSLGDEPLRLAPGTYPSALKSPAPLPDSGRIPLRLDHWKLYATSMTRTDGYVLDGSTSLWATRSDDSEAMLLVPPPMGMVYAKQEILWVGRLTAASQVDVLLRRVTLTGEVEHLIVIAGSLAGVASDPERPVRAFSSGVGNYLYVDHPHAQTHTPAERFEQAVAVSFDEGEWNARSEEARNAGVPTRLFERTVPFQDQPLRITADYLPAWADWNNGASSVMTSNLWSGSVLLTVTWRGKSQVLFTAGGLDGGPFDLRFGLVGNEPAIEASYWPHYNNQYEFRWVRRISDGRFVRVYVRQSQGC